MAEKETGNLTIQEKIRMFNGMGNWQIYTAEGKIPTLVMSDGPHGLRKQDFESYANINKSTTATCFPTASCLASSWNPEVSAKAASAIAKEAKTQKVQLVLGPGMNIKRSPLCGRNFEYFSEDPYLTAILASSYVKAMQSQGVGSCIKHFACNNQEKRRQTSSSNVSESTLRKIYLSAFEYVVKNAAPAAIMCSYNKINGTYTSHNRHLLTEILRQEWNYDGTVISDWGACINAPESLKAGLDLAMPDSKGYITKQLQTAFDNGTISQSDLDKANQRVINLAQKYPPVSFSSENLLQENHNLAVQLAQESAVLLKNNGLLPLSPEKNQDITVIGSLAQNMKFQGGGSSHINTACWPNALECLENQGFKITYSQGYYSGFCKSSKSQKKNAPYIKKALATIEQAARNKEPVLIFCGLTEAYEGEGFDRTSLSLPEEQITLISQALKITRNIILVSFSGSPVDFSFAKDCNALLQMYLCGQGCGQATANLLTGKANPSGKLAETWPLKIQDTPSYNNFSLETDQINYLEENLVGYRWYNSKKIPVQFPFGYGLSYTTFELKTSSSDKWIPSANATTDFPQPYQFELPENQTEISIQIKNTGNLYGAEVLQLYKNGELCNFLKIFLNPGEEKTVVLKDSGWLENYGQLPATKTLATTKSPFHSESNAVPFTLTSSLQDMAKSSLRVRIFLKILKTAIILMNRKSSEDPSVKIMLSAIEENPVESLISTSGGMISQKLASRLVKWSN